MGSSLPSLTLLPTKFLNPSTHTRFSTSGATAQTRFSSPDWPLDLTPWLEEGPQAAKGGCEEQLKGPGPQQPMWGCPDHSCPRELSPILTYSRGSLVCDHMRKERGLSLGWALTTVGWPQMGTYSTPRDTCLELSSRRCQWALVLCPHCPYSALQAQW